jgi:putative nucleotidyltransferase with HDIG domain
VIRQRVRQFFEASRLPTEEDLAFARSHLPPNLLGLFLSQHPRDILHSVNAARYLLAHGHAEPDLVAAALVHDIGKGHQRRPDRVVFVLATGAGLTGRLAGPSSRLEWRRAVSRSLHHAETGAALLESAGASPAVVELVRQHHAREGGNDMLTALQGADAAT